MPDLDYAAWRAEAMRDAAPDTLPYFKEAENMLSVFEERGDQFSDGGKKCFLSAYVLGRAHNRGKVVPLGIAEFVLWATLFLGLPVITSLGFENASMWIRGGLWVLLIFVVATLRVDLTVRARR